MKKTLLPVGFNDMEIKKLRTAVEVLETEIIPVYEDGYDKTIGAYLGLPIDGGQTGAGIDGQMIVIAGFEQQELNTLLRLMKNAGFSRDVLKAVATPANIGWTFSALWKELSEEHRQMNGG